MLLQKINRRVIKVILLFMVACGLSLGLHAQIGKRILNRAKNSAEHKVNSKIDEKVDKTVDKTINEIDTLLTGKKSNPTDKETTRQPVEPQPPIKEKENTSVANPSTTENTTLSSLPTPNLYAQQMNTEWVSDVIFTNIKCDKGKRSVEKKLSAMKGIKSVSINITNGELSISYFANEIAYNTIINTINQLYFIADGKAPAGNKDGCQ